MLYIFSLSLELVSIFCKLAPIRKLMFLNALLASCCPNLFLSLLPTPVPLRVKKKHFLFIPYNTSASGHTSFQVTTICVLVFGKHSLPSSGLAKCN